MPNFSVGTQIKKELEDFKKRIRLTQPAKDNAESVRFASSKRWGYDYNQRELLNLIDLYSNSQFESGPYDNSNQRKLFLNVGVFRRDVESKQIQLGTKDGRFLPTPTADPFTAFFMERDFHEWAKDVGFADLINTWEDKYPTYGTIVGKKVGSDIVDLPLQNIEAMEQTAESIQTATHFIEGHPKMRSWEIQSMTGWNLKDITLRYDEEYDVYERSGYVPASWLDKQKGVTDPEVVRDASVYVDARVIGFWPKNDKTKEFHVFFCEEVTDRGYREQHRKRLHGRWMGVGVMEEQLENQRAKNVSINLMRRWLQWAAKRVWQTANSDLAAKSLVRDVQDGEILDVGQNGELKEVPMQGKMTAEFGTFLAEFEKNSDQKAFTYEVATGERTNMTATLGVLLSKAANSHFAKIREGFGLFLKEIIIDFKVPQFLRDMDNTERVLTLFSDENGFEMLKEAAMQWVRSEVSRAAFFSGKPVDANMLAQAIEPWQAARMLFANKKKGQWKNAKAKFDLDFTGESVDIESKLQTLNMLYQTLVAKGDSRSEAVLQRMAILGGENMSTFGAPGNPNPKIPNTESTPNPKPPSTGRPSPKTALAASA